ncbi:TPA: O12 family O-antigen polymerase [Escherichia coli]|nr:O12 family O-antigen polymerase [Escherichia coli]HDC5050019.1 O12 family O-antigen polymerase [Escherichia coli]
MNHSYIYVYIFFVFLSFFELNDTNRARCDLYYAIQVIVLLLTMGLSYQIGVDWVEYERVYNGNSESLNNYEFGYIVLNNIANYLGASFWGFVILIKYTFFISLFLMVRKFSRLPVLTTTLILGLLFPFINDPLRQIISASILFFTIYFYNRPPKILGIIGGGVFHSTFIIIIIRYLKIFTKRSIVLIFVFVGVAILLFLKYGSFLGDGMLFRKLNFYMEYSSLSNLYGFALRFLLLSFIVFNIDVYKANCKFIRGDICYYFWIFSITYLWLEIIFVTFPLIPQRMQLYLLPFAFILLSNYLYYSRLTFTKNILAFICVIISFSSLCLFLDGPMGHFYSITDNIVLKYIQGFTNDKTYDANQFWINGI